MAEKKQIAESGVALGSSRWRRWEGLPAQAAAAGDKLILGYPTNEGEDLHVWNDAGLSFSEKSNLLAFPPKRHFLTIAPTRSGKGVSSIIPNLLQWRGSCVVIDPKGENAWITANRRRAMGQKVFILDPWKATNRRYGDFAGEQEEIAAFNPLSILDTASPDYADDVAYLADALIINQGQDPHWDNSARELVAGLLSYVVETYGEAASLPMVRLLLSKPAEEIAGIAKNAQSLGHESLAARKLGRFVVDSREISSIVSTALTQTAFLDSKTLSDNLKETSFSFDELLTEAGATIYLVLPVDKLQTYGRWLRLMVSIGIRTIARNTKPLALPVLFMLDEFGTIGKLSAVAQAYGLMAGLSMIIWAFVQDLVQLKRDYPDDWETFIGNSEAVTFFNVMDQFTAEYCSKLLGKETITNIKNEVTDKPTFNRQHPYGWAEAEAQSRKGELENRGPVSRALMEPAEVRTSREDMGLIVSRQGASRFFKVSYFEDALFFEHARRDPHFPTSTS